MSCEERLLKARVIKEPFTAAEIQGENPEGLSDGRGLHGTTPDRLLNRLFVSHKHSPTLSFKQIVYDDEFSDLFASRKSNHLLLMLFTAYRMTQGAKGCAGEGS